MFGNTYKGLRVLDLATNIAGPLAAMIFGDMGADVIKVERSPYGDDTRLLPPKTDGTATVFASVNRNKRSVRLDYRDATCRQALEVLIKGADVLIDSFPPGIADKLDLTRASISRINPSIVHCSVSAFGAGPTGKDMPGYDALVQAVSGLMSFTGVAGGDSVRIAPSVLDISTGMWATIGIMAALKRRDVSGAGDFVQTALIDSAFMLMCHQVVGFFATGEAPEKLGSGAPSAVPYRVYAATDGEFMLATASNSQFERLCNVLDCDNCLSDDRFATMEGRIRHRQELDALLEPVFRERTVDSWLAILGQAGLSVGRVNSVSEALDLPVVEERGLFPQFRLPGSDQRLRLVRNPLDVKLSSPMQGPPALGSHTAEVLEEAGIDRDQIDAIMRLL